MANCEQRNVGVETGDRAGGAFDLAPTGRERGISCRFVHRKALSPQPSAIGRKASAGKERQRHARRAAREQRAPFPATLLSKLVQRSHWRALSDQRLARGGRRAERVASRGEQRAPSPANLPSRLAHRSCSGDVSYELLAVSRRTGGCGMGSEECCRGGKRGFVGTGAVRYQGVKDGLRKQGDCPWSFPSRIRRPPPCRRR